MTITNQDAGTRIDEIEDGIYRICTPVTKLPGGFSFNQYLIVDEEPLLFHTGPRKLFPLTAEAIAHVMPAAKLRHIAFSHIEADEMGALNAFLAVAPHATPLCGKIAARVSVNDMADREARALGNGEAITLGRRTVEWHDAPHMPHGWECGYLFERGTRTLLCGDLFTEGGSTHPPLIEGDDIVEPSERFRAPMDYYSHAKNGRAILARFAEMKPRTLARMHGSAWRGDGAAMLMALADALDQSPAA